LTSIREIYSFFLFSVLKLEKRGKNCYFWFPFKYFSTTVSLLVFNSST
jgi:hypothetical protein